MSIANERPKRQNAGSKMSRLIENEEEDDFYKTAYGGFSEVGSFLVIYKNLKLNTKL
jgi:hypothetical protein